MNRFNKAMENDVLKKVLSVTAIFLLVVMLLPLFFYSQYNFICLDDYSIGAQTHLAWVNRTDFFSGICDVIMSVANRVSVIYMEWGGNYSSMIFTSLQPAIFNEKLAFLNTYILLGSLIFSVVYFFYKIFYKDMGFSLLTIILMISGVLILSTQWLPSAVEGFYWFNGSFYNIVGYAMGLVFAANMYEIALGKKVKWGGYLLTTLIGIFVAGTNYTIMLFLMLLGIIFGGYRLLQDNRTKNMFYYACVYAVFVIFCFVNICAPGNSVRQGSFANMSVVGTIYNGLMTGREMFLDGMDARMLILFIVLLPSLFLDLSKSKIEFRCPFLFTAVIYCLFSSLFAPTLYAMHSIGPVRTQNVYYWTLILLHLCNFVYWVGWLQRKIGKTNIVQTILKGERLFVNHFCICIFLIFLLFEQVDISGMTSFIAIKSVVSGEAAIWKDEMNLRLEQLNDSDKKNVRLAPISVQPELVFTTEIESDADSWFNTCMAEWYQKETVALDAGDTD